MITRLSGRPDAAKTASADILQPLQSLLEGGIILRDSGSPFLRQFGGLTATRSVAGAFDHYSPEITHAAVLLRKQRK